MAGLLNLMFSVALGALMSTLAVPWSGISAPVQLGEQGIDIC